MKKELPCIAQAVDKYLPTKNGAPPLGQSKRLELQNFEREFQLN